MAAKKLKNVGKFTYDGKTTTKLKKPSTKKVTTLSQLRASNNLNS